jgi:hypothetical protein
MVDPTTYDLLGRDGVCDDMENVEGSRIKEENLTRDMRSKFPLMKEQVLFFTNATIWILDGGPTIHGWQAFQTTISKFPVRKC